MKLFLSDLDGTLLNDEKIITPDTMAALRDFTEAGNVFAICTGRATESALSVQKNLGLTFPHVYVISYNGGEIISCDENRKFFRIGIPLDLAKQVVETASSLHIHIHTYNDRYIVSRDYDEELRYYRQAVHTPAVITEDIWKELPDPPCKFIAISLHDRKALEELQRILTEKFPEDLSTVFSSPYYLEVIPKESGKGNAVLHMCDLLNIPVSDTLAAGDEENDISMIRAAGLGIAMKNGIPSVKDAADAVTGTDNNHDGLVPFLRAAVG